MLKLKLNRKPRSFKLKGVEILDHGAICLSPDRVNSTELFSLKNSTGGKVDIAATNWGYYLGPSLNSRLVKQGYKAALMLNSGNQLYLVAVAKNKIKQFRRYVKANDSIIISWLDEWLNFQEIKSPYKE